MSVVSTFADGHGGETNNMALLNFESTMVGCGDPLEGYNCSELRDHE
jgi:hypothetical protein